MTGQAQNDVATASGRKDAVRKAFNQEYMATQKAMSQAAERARAQVLDQRQTIAGHAQDVRTGAQAPQPPVGNGSSAQPHGQSSAKPAAAYPPGVPGQDSDQQIMFEIANEIRNIIAREIDLRMQLLSEKVETALANAFPPADPDQSTTKNNPPTSSKTKPTGRTSRSTKKS
jgi:hypothetical protein